MKKKVSILLILVLITTFMFVGADTGKVTGLLANTKLFLNGTRIDKQIVVIDNTSYLPLRALAEALGLEVEWNAQENSILLTGNVTNTNADLAVQQEIVEALQKENKELKAELAKFKPTLPVEGDFPIMNARNSIGNYITDSALYKNKWYNDELFKVDGKSYDNGIGILMVNDRINIGILNHNLKYTKFTGYFAFDDMSKNADVDSINITVTTGTASGKVLYENTIKKSDGLVKFDIDITGVIEPRMLIKHNGYDRVYPVIINPALK